MREIYLNNSATSWPKPPGLADHIKGIIENIPVSHGRSDSYSEDDTDHILNTRNKIADFFCVKDPSDIIFTSGATHGLNMLIRDEVINGDVITSVTEHNAVLRPLKVLEDKTVHYIECDQNAFVDTDALKKRITEKVTHVVINHASNVTGTLQNIDKIYKIVRDQGKELIIDASQSAGSAEIDISLYSEAAWIFTGHKGLMGLPGAGFSYIPPHYDIPAFIMGGNGVMSELEHMPPQRPLKYEAGTMNISGIASIGYGLSFIRKTGLEKIIKHKRNLHAMLVDILSQTDNINISGAVNSAVNTGVVAFEHDTIPSDEFCDMLGQGFGIHCRCGLHCAPEIHRSLGTFENGLIRVSPSWFTTEDEIEYFAEAVKKICRR
ncbi:MAG: aminotransferase class V-fold PLP-dependent enzyme [Candidatus Muiribacteriaceae bacterium]